MVERSIWQMYQLLLHIMVNNLESYVRLQDMNEKATQSNG